MFGAASLKQSGENRANSNNTNQRSQIDESSTRSPAPEIIVALEIKENLSLKSAIETIAKSDLYTVEYDPGCEERFLNATVNGGEMKGNSSAEIIERLQDRLKDRRLRITYTVETYRERAIYAIQCVKK